MSKQIIIGLITEGPTDIRFLESIVRRTFEDIAFECTQDIDIFVHTLKTPKIGSFIEYTKNASNDGIESYGIMTLAVHTDADRDTYEERINNKIIPAQNALNELNNDYCKLLTPIIPVRMIEAWMLADKELLKTEIGTTKSDSDLGINRDPETIANPKHAIEEAIRMAMDHLPKRRRKLSIAELYAIIGDTISIQELKKLDSYRKFQDAVRNTYRVLNYMH